MFFPRELLLDLFWPLVAAIISRASAAVISVPVPVPVPILISVSIPIPIPLPVPITIMMAAVARSLPSFAVPAALSAPLSLLFAFAPALLALLLSLLVSLALLLAPGLPSLPLLLPALHLFLFADLALQLPLLLLYLSQLLPDSLPLGSPGRRVGGVFLVRLASPLAFFLGGLVSELRSPQVAHVRFYSIRVDERFDDRLGILVQPAPLQSAIDESGGLASVQGQELGWVTLDLLLGYL